MLWSQDRYNLINDHVTLDDFNPAYFDYLKVKNSWYNRTTRTFGCDLKLLRDINEKWWFDIKMFQLRNNEYHSFLPMNMAVHISDVIKNNYMGLKEIFEKHNVLFSLPIVKGKYLFKHILPDISKTPPVLVAGKYKVQTTIFDGKTPTCKLTWIGSIVEKVAKKS